MANAQDYQLSSKIILKMYIKLYGQYTYSTNRTLVVNDVDAVLGLSSHRCLFFSFFFLFIHWT